ncbi:MAG: MerR family transcriptional regulator [Firmicutes bacterium]|nr:MerR family transcriptional regulator [Bacillota bacterium]
MANYLEQGMNNNAIHTEEIQLNPCSEEGQDNTDRTVNYTEDDWALVKDKAHEIYKKIVIHMDKGADSLEVQKLIAELRQHITADVCNCTPELLRQLGNIYAFNKRFTGKVDHYRDGFAAFLRKAIYIYCDNINET